NCRWTGSPYKSSILSEPSPRLAQTELEAVITVNATARNCFIAIRDPFTSRDTSFALFHPGCRHPAFLQSIPRRGQCETKRPSNQHLRRPRDDAKHSAELKSSAAPVAPHDCRPGHSIATCPDLRFAYRRSLGMSSSADDYSDGVPRQYLRRRAGRIPTP